MWAKLPLTFVSYNRAMFRQKKIALFLLAAGSITFLSGVYCFNKEVMTQREGKSIKNSTLTGTSAPGTNIGHRAGMYTGLLVLSTLMIGAGGYLEGRLKSKPQRHSLTLDFTNQIDRN
jgi:hypothetical protein